MSAKFTGSGNFKVDAGINYVKLKIDISWQDSATSYGLALKSLSFSADNRTVEWSRSDDNYSGNADRTFNLSGSRDSVTEVSVSYQSQDTPLKIDKKSDKKIVFYDGEGTDANVTITLTILESVPFEDGGVTPIEGTPQERVVCPPGPWSQSVPPLCGSPPTGVSSTGGLQISKTDQNKITLNLKNYANKLVSLKITHSVSASWTQSFSFSIPNCSDISPDTGGTPYSKGSYSNSNITGTNIFYVYNIDGGDYDYVFTHGSIPGPAPWRQLQTEYCPPPEGDPPSSPPCYCVPAGIETFSPWPYCPTGVAVSKNGGDKVQWQYEDGGGGNYDDQYVTVEVISTRSVVSSVGPICNSLLKNNVWVPDSSQSTAVGNCIGDYRDHSSKIRFRMPALKASKTSFTDPVCYSTFRGVAGAAPPDSQLGTSSVDYAVLHVFNDDFSSTSSLVTSYGITVTPVNPTDNYHSTFGEDPPSLDDDLGTDERKYYNILFTDDTEIDGEEAGNINITFGQNVTAGGLNTELSVFRKQRVSSKEMNVWFYISYKEDEPFTDDIIHVFDDDANVTTTLSIPENTDIVLITPENPTDDGGGTLNTSTKKSYLITFSDSTVVNTDGTNIDIDAELNKTASGLDKTIYVSKKEKVDNNKLRVWFTAYESETDTYENTFVRSWSIRRIKTNDLSGNVFARTWYLSKII